MVGLGFRNSITATIWNDKNQNGLRDSGEIDLGAALITGSDDFTTTLTINNPPFSSDLNTNGINAVDGRNRTIIPGRRYMGAISGAPFTESIPKYKLESSIKVDPSTAAIGDRVQVTARDFVPGGNTDYARISIGGVAVTDVESMVVSDTGNEFFEITIPDGVPVGVQNLVIKDGPNALNDPGHDIVNGEGARFNMVITGGVIPSTLASPIIRTPIVTGDRSLSVTWRAPIETRGLTPIGYGLRYIRTDADEPMEADWTLVETIWKFGFDPLEYVLTGLAAGVQYDVQLRAFNVHGTGPWSATATGIPSTWGAVRYLSETYVEPGGEVGVAIIATGYGRHGHVVETLPPGFSYAGSSLNEDAVIVSGQEVIFFLSGQEEFIYIVTAPGVAREHLPTPTPTPRSGAALERQSTPIPTPTDMPMPRRRRGGEHSFFGFFGNIVNENRLQQTVGGAASIRVGVEPLVNAVSLGRGMVRIDSPIPVAVIFSGPVFGFAVEDVVVSNGVASNFADSGAVYTFDVTPNAIGEVVVDIDAGAATDAEGNGNMAAPQLLLGIPYDDDHDGEIDKDEAIAAVADYFAGRISKEHAVDVIILFFSR